MPPKPKKLTPIFSKKRSEIMQQTGLEATSPTKKPKKAKSKAVEDINLPYGPSDTSMASPKKKTKKKGSKTGTEVVTSAREDAKFGADMNDPQKDAKSKFDTIWDADQLAPKVGEGQLGTIGEEFAPLKITRTKSYLGGKVAKLDDEHINNLSNVQDSNNPITYKKAKSPTKTDQNSNDNAALVDEFNKAQSSSSSFGNT